MKKYTKGFTLIELLVVIAIIGILASVVLVSLNSARKKGNDTRVISDVNQVRTQLESDYANGTYSGDLTSNAGTNVNALLAGAVGTSTLNTLIGDAQSNGGILYVITTGSTGPTGYAVFGALPSYGGYTGSMSTTHWFCIASNGSTNQNVIGSSTLSVSCQ